MSTNNVLFNAAYNGFLEGAIAGRPLSDAVAVDYLVLTQAAQAFATQVDSKIAFDPLITTGVGTPTMLAQTTNVISANVLARAQLMRGLASAAMQGRPLLDPVAADYNSVASAVAALYTEAILLLIIP